MAVCGAAGREAGAGGCNVAKRNSQLGEGLGGWAGWAAAAGLEMQLQASLQSDHQAAGAGRPQPAPVQTHHSPLHWPRRRRLPPAATRSTPAPQPAPPRPPRPAILDLTAGRHKAHSQNTRLTARWRGKHGGNLKQKEGLI